MQQESRAMARKPRDAAPVRFGLKFADAHYKLQSSQAAKARLQSWSTTEFNAKRPFKVTHFVISGKATRD